MGVWSSLVYGTGLENRRLRDGSVSSNLTAPANMESGQDGNAADC